MRSKDMSANPSAIITMKNTLAQSESEPLPETRPAKSGPTAAPIEPVPSMMAVTVAKAWLDFTLVPSSAETAVVIKA